MKRIFIILIVFIIPMICFSQERVFSIGYIFSPEVTGKMPKKANARIVVKDSVFMQIIGKDTITYGITKKVNQDYFKATDGLKEYIIRIWGGDIGKWKHTIKIEDGDRITSFLSVD